MLSALTFLIFAQALPCRNSGKGISKLDEHACQKRYFVKCQIAGDGIGERGHRARQFQ